VSTILKNEYHHDATLFNDQHSGGPTNRIALDGFGVPAGRDRGTPSVGMVSTVVALLAIGVVSSSRADRCRGPASKALPLLIHPIVDTACCWLAGSKLHREEMQLHPCLRGFGAVAGCSRLPVQCQRRYGSDRCWWQHRFDVGAPL